MKIIDAHSHIGNFGSWARFDFDLVRLKEQMDEFDIEKTLLTGANCNDNDSVIDAFQKEPDLVVPVAWVNPGRKNELSAVRRHVEQDGFRAIKLHPLFDAYDAAHRLSESSGAVYPVHYTYDTAGHRTGLSTTRDGNAWDTTTWTFNPATGFCTLKTYADGSTVAYSYTSDGKPIRTTYASGRWRENVYNAKRELVSTTYSDGETCAFAYDEFSNEVAASNDVSAIVSTRSNYGQATNETIAVGSETYSLDRSFDAYGRMIRNDGSDFTFAADGQLAAISNAIANVEYLYTADLLDAGYTVALPNGVSFTRSLTRDAYRRSLVTGIENSVGGSVIESLAYSYDALNRPIARNTDTFGYNDHSEVTSATISGIANGYDYDEIGNSTSYTPNSLNQYTEFSYDLDGNLLTDGIRTFTYDAANRLKTVTANGALALTNYYDAKSRRVRKLTPEAATTFFYDGWNLVEERIAYTNGTTSTIHYHWGKDLSGTLQGAGGVGGLLYLTVDGAIYVPFYDNNGNITRYLDANGNTVAQYTYDAFDNTIAQSGSLANFFRHRFSTKYYDSETALYYYGYRFYHSILMRWLNRDPLEEEGGLNLYAFCDNDVIHSYDLLGLSAFVLIYDSADPMFRTWAEDTRRRISSNSNTRYNTAGINFDSKKDSIYMIPIRSSADIDGLSSIKDVKYLASFGHGAGGKIWWGYIDAKGVSRSYVTGMDGFRVRRPEITTTIPFTKLLLDFNKCDFVVEIYHCTSAQQFELNVDGTLAFANQQTATPKPATSSSQNRGSTISALQEVMKKKYPKTRFSVVGSELGVSNGYPLNRGWPRPQGEVRRVEVSP